MKRWDVLKKYVKEPKVGAEIGINDGTMAERVLNLIPSLERYYAIDPWQMYDGYKETLGEKGKRVWNQQYLDNNFNKFKEVTKPYKDKIIILKMLSDAAIYFIDDGELDFVFIDGNHSYEFAKEDIELFIPKVKRGGLVGGHDYNLPDVQRAVNEVFGLYDHQLNFFTSENKTWWWWK